jgi:hypothetical protein
MEEHPLGILAVYFYQIFIKKNTADPTNRLLE